MSALIAPAVAQTLALNFQTAVRAYAAAVEDAIRAYAMEMTEPCARAVVVYYRPDGSIIERVDVEPEPIPDDELSIPSGAAPLA